MRQVIALVLLAAFLTGCSGGKRKEDTLTDQQIQEAQQRVKDLDQHKPN